MDSTFTDLLTKTLYHLYGDIFPILAVVPTYTMDQDQTGI